MLAQLFQYGGIIIILTILYKLIFYTLIELIIIKLKFGKANLFAFYPFMGPMKTYKDGEK